MKQSPSAMDFFAHQDEARKNSRRFVVLYAGAVITICVAVGIVFGLVGYFYTNSPQSSPLVVALMLGGVSAVISALVILAGSAYRISELRGGGQSVAMGLGGHLIDPSSRDPDERRVLNVVEEMAIASGVPVPPVFMMPNEKGINAFAAGYRPGDAVIGVTRGCVVGLTRDELQGVMAHEFSHILNGDMRLNIRMIGLLNGILIITIAGRILMEIAPRSTSRSKEGAGAIIFMFLIAVCLLVIGSIGALAARIIQSAVSRQREFLADASAVQFTRNPDGIGDALRRIGGANTHGLIRNPRAEEASHMFFGQARRLSSAFATHPPLGERIKRIMPGWDGSYLEPKAVPQEAPKPADPRQRIRSAMGELGDLTGGPGEEGVGEVARLLPLLALSGTMTPRHVAHAKSLIGKIPDRLKEAARDAYSGRAVVYAMLLDRKDGSMRNRQLEHLKAHTDSTIFRLVESISTEAVGLGRELRMPLLDMTLGSLAHLSESQHTSFRRNVDALIKMDKSIDLFEWMTINTLRRHLDDRFGLAKPAPVQYYNLKRLGHEVSVLLSMLAYTGAKDEYAAGEAVLMGESAVRGIGLKLLPRDQADMRALDTALKALDQCSAQIKKKLLQASAIVVGADRVVTINEAEMLRAIADSLGVPTPPLLPGQQLA